MVNNVKQDARHFTEIDVAFGHITHDLIALPLKRWEGDPIGVLEVMNKKKGHLDQEDVAILTIISAFTALSIEQARLFEEMKVAQVAHLLGDISHDIKNMMMPIMYGAWLLQNKKTADRITEGWADGGTFRRGNFVNDSNQCSLHPKSGKRNHGCGKGVQ